MREMGVDSLPFGSQGAGDAVLAAAHIVKSFAAPFTCRLLRRDGCGECRPSFDGGSGRVP